MKKFRIFPLLMIGMLSLFTACEKDGDKVVMLDNPVAPEIKTMPDLNLQRINGLNILTFEGTAVNPGFQASAAYSLEACAAGNNFVDAVVVATGVQPLFKLSVSDLNGILIKKFPSDQQSQVDFRIKAVLVIDNGGASPVEKEYISASKTVAVNIYGLPRLDLIGSGMTQKIESALGDGVYKGYVKLDPAAAFTLSDPDNGKVYGDGGSGTLVENGAAIAPGAAGWHMMNANINAPGSYSMDAYMIGLVGSATPNGWDTPDQKMDYDAQTGKWFIEIDLIVGEVKFRKNDGWAWNLGGDNLDNLVQGGANLPIPAAGRYRITLTIIDDATGQCTIDQI